MSRHLDRRTILGMGCTAALLPDRALSRSTVQTLSVGDRLERFSWLRLGVRTYLRSVQHGEQHIAVDIWRREIRFEAIDGVERLRILQRWDGADQPSILAERDSIFELETFRPLTHRRVTTRDGVVRVEAFRFADRGVVGMEEVADNERAGFSQPSTEPMFNFEADSELLQALPLAMNYAVSIPLCHPGGGLPTRYVWRVTSDQRLRGPGDGEIDCWVVETDYNTPGSPPARFWMAKSTQQFIKLEAQAPDGAMHYKRLLQA